MSKIITILGSTATGKTAMAVKLAKKFDGEIICADSRTIYLGMDIGTAKPSQIEQDGIPHHLLDVVEPGKIFSAAQFKELAIKRITDIQSRRKLPFLVGGSGLYIDSVLYDYKFERLANKQTVSTERLSLAQLQSAVAQQYPEIELNNSELNNPRRLQQILANGPVKVGDRDMLKIETLVLGIDVEMPIIKQNIALRTKHMLNNGLVQEVKNLIQKYGADCPQLQTTGYKEVVGFINNNTTMNELELYINTATYQLAKKQLTWFKRNNQITWIKNYQEAETSISDYLAL